MASDDLRARIAEALDGAFTSVADFDAETGAAAVLAAVQPELDRLTAEAEEARRALLEEPVLRHCVYPACLREFDASAALDGRPTREAWGSVGWLQVKQLGGYICPEHAPVVAEEEHRPQWRHGDGPSVLACACGWESVPVRWRGHGVEAWKDHVLTISEESLS